MLEILSQFVVSALGWPEPPTSFSILAMLDRGACVPPDYSPGKRLFNFSNYQSLLPESFENK